MTGSDRYYFEARAEEELERARQATDSQIVASHHYLAKLYLEKLDRSKDETGLLRRSRS